MSSRSMKNFPPGTFIPTSQRLMAIIQLCLAFSLLLWYIAQPFMGEYFHLRSRMLLYEYVMGTSGGVKANADLEEKLSRQAQRFVQLSNLDQEWIRKDYQYLQIYAQRPFFQKVEDGLRRLIHHIPPFEQAWIFFSITLAILILLKVEGVKQAIWLLPLIVFFYALDNQLTGHPQSRSPDYELFPTEEMIVQRYLKGSLPPTFFEQKEQLESGWKKYLIDTWSSHLNEKDSYPLEEAEFNFTLARLKRLKNQPLSEWLNLFHEKLGYFSLFIYLLWNGWFAWMVTQSTETRKIALM